LIASSDSVAHSDDASQCPAASWAFEAALAAAAAATEASWAAFAAEATATSKLSFNAVPGLMLRGAGAGGDFIATAARAEVIRKERIEPKWLRNVGL
jgi:capsid protein